MAVQVTAAQSANTANGLVLRVIVLTGSAKSAFCIGGSAQTYEIGQTSFAPSGTIQQSSSRVYGASARGGANSASSGSGATVVDDVSDPTNGARYVTFKNGAPSTGSQAIGYTVSPAASGPVAWAEILAAAGQTLAEDASSPPGVSTTSATSVQSAAFGPPPGSLLVALVGSDAANSGIPLMSVTDTSGLTWTEQVKNNANGGGGYAGVWTADVPPAVSAPLPLVPPGLQSPAAWALAIPAQGLPYLGDPWGDNVPVWDTDSGHFADGGEFIVKDTDSGHFADAGELVSNLFTSADAGTGTDAGELVTPLDADAATGAEAATVGVHDSDAGTGADISTGIETGSVAGVIPGSDILAGQVVPGLWSPAAWALFLPPQPPLVSPVPPVSVFDTETGYFLESDGYPDLYSNNYDIAPVISFSDSGPFPGGDQATGADTGEVINVTDNNSPQLGPLVPPGLQSPAAWQQPAVPQPDPSFPNLLAQSDAGTGADAGELITLSDADSLQGADGAELIGFSITSADAGHFADGGELVTVFPTDADAGRFSDGGEALAQGTQVYFQVQPDIPPGLQSPAAWRAAQPPLPDASQQALTITSADAGHFADAGEMVAKPPPPVAGQPIFESFSLLRASVLAPSTGLEGQQLYACRNGTLGLNYDVVPCMADDDTLWSWIVIRSATLQVDLGFISFPVLQFLTGGNIASSGTAPRDYYGVADEVMYSRNIAQVPVVLRALSRDPLSRTRTFDIVLYRCAFAGVTPTTSKTYKNGMTFGYEAIALPSQIDEAGNQLAHPAIGRIISEPGILTGPVGRLAFVGQE